MGPRGGLIPRAYYPPGKEAVVRRKRKRADGTNSPVLRSLAQLSDRNGKFAGSVRFQKFLQSHEPLVVLVDNGETLPAPGLHQIDVRLKYE